MLMQWLWASPANHTRPWDLGTQHPEIRKSTLDQLYFKEKAEEEEEGEEEVHLGSFLALKIITLSSFKKIR